MPLTARGGGTGLAGGAIPVEGGVVIGFERLNKIRQFDPLLWRMHVEAGVTTGDVQRLARESGLRFPPDPGAAEISQIGGNIACNAGGPHAFKYGVTGHWVTGIEAVIPPGEIVRFGGPIRKDVAGYDLKSLLVGSEGTLGLVTAAWLRLIPAPELELPVIGLYRDADAGISAIERVLASGVVPAAIEYLDEVTLRVRRRRVSVRASRTSAAFMVITEADGAIPEARRVAGELREALAEDAVAVHAPDERVRRRRPVALARRRRVRDPRPARRRVQRGHRRAARPPARRRARDARDRRAPRRPGAVVRPRRRRQHPLDLPLLARERRRGAPRGRGVPRAVRARAAARRHRQRRARDRLAEARPARAASSAPTGYDLHTRIKQTFDPKGLLNPGKKN